MEKLINDLSERADAASTVLRFLRQGFSEIERRQKNLDLARESVVERMMEIETLRESYEKGLKDLEEKELDFCTFKEGEKRKLAMEEDDLNVKRGELLNDVKMREEKMNEQLLCLSEKINLMEMGQRSMHEEVEEKLKEIESQEEKLDSAWDYLSKKERDINTVVRKMHRNSRLVEEMENEFNSKVQRKMREIVLKEKELNLRWDVFIKEVQSADERFSEKVRLSERLKTAENKVECLLAVVNQSFNKIEARESAVMATVEESVKQSDLIRELMEKELGEFEKLKEDGLNEKIKLLIEDADEELTKREKLGNKLLERLNLAQENVEQLKETVHEKFKQVGLKEIEVKSTQEWVEKKMCELEKKEESLISMETQLEEKLKKLQSWEKELQLKQGEVDSVQELTRNCFKENTALRRQLLLEKDLIKRREKDLDLSDSVDIKFILSMNGNTLQMFLNDPEKDLESMGDEILQVLHLSLDPAKLILDAMVGFYPPHLRKDDVGINVRRTCIILLKQLSKMTKVIQPSTSEEATELASSWRSKMGASGEDPLEVLGFLHLLAAYNIAPRFDEDEVLSFLKIADQLGQRPEWFRDFGFEDDFTDSTDEVESQPASEEVKT